MLYWQDEVTAVLCDNDLLVCLFIYYLLFIYFSGSTWLAKVALQHQPAAAEPPSADEGGRWRGCQGERVEVVLHCADYTLLSLF